MGRKKHLSKDKIEIYNKCIDFANRILDLEELTPDDWKEYEYFKSTNCGFLPIRWSINEIKSVSLIRRISKRHDGNIEGVDLSQWDETPYFKYYEDDTYIQKWGVN